LVILNLIFSSAPGYVFCKETSNKEEKGNYCPREFFLDILQFISFSLPERTHSLVRFYCSIEGNVHQVFQEGGNPRTDYISFRWQELSSFLPFVSRP